MGDRFEHEWQHDGPSWIAGSGTCRHCSQSDEGEGSRDECPVRLRTEVERLRAEADRTKDAWDRDVAELHAAREENERLRARVADLEVICNEPDPLPTELLAAQMDGDMRVVEMMRERDAALARVAELEARPTVHPLAWGRLRTESEYWNEDSGERGLYSMRSALEYWRDEDCPLTATGGEVLAPGEEP